MAEGPAIESVGQTDIEEESFEEESAEDEAEIINTQEEFRCIGWHHHHHQGGDQPYCGRLCCTCLYHKTSP